MKSLRAALTTRLATSLAVGMILTTPVHAQGDPDAGGDVFDSYCSDCHSVSPAGTNKKGPTLYRVVGRRAGTVPGFAYSAMLKASGVTWTPDKIDVYLTNPKAYVPQGIMKFKGLPKPQDRANVIAYLMHPD